ncbi:MAG: isocitrate/isopropylmalate dehydrogenase family protein [Myxococcales bacterium]|nr:isocitrate/isopropylmalate dehydrogenase family protein [Myxococcales bacterium]
MLRIALLPGDGIGPEVIEEAKNVLAAAADRFSIQWQSETLDLGADRYLRTGDTLPQADFDHLRDDFDAIVVGAFGDPRVPTNIHAKDILLGLRQRLDLYVNLRPVRLLDTRFCPLKDRGPADIDMAIVRENTESVYTGIGGHLRKDTPHEVAQSIMISTRMACDRLLHYAFQLAGQRRKIVTLCDKANAIPHAHGLWRRSLAAVAPQYPDIEARTLYSDVAAMRMVTHPQEFDVVVGDNLMGDMLSDLAAALVGGLGLAPSASLHPGSAALYEPVHGSAPDIVGTGKANPLAAIMSVAMLLRDFGHTAAANAVDAACENAVMSGSTTPDLGGNLATAEVGAYICAQVAAA